ncbi:hypothetical protein V2O64_17120 [Verrucomicrobiaceae bacterium 227]
MLSITPLLASPTVEESFPTGLGSYTLGALVGLVVPTTGFTGPWLPTYLGSGVPAVLTTGLGYSDGTHSMTVRDGAIDYRSNGRVGRVLAQPYTNLTSGPVYFSVLMKVEASQDEYRGFELFEGGFNENNNRVLQIATGEPGVGATDSSYVLRMFNDTANFSVDLGESDGEVNLFVGRIDFSAEAESDTLTLWRNPEDLMQEGNSTADGFLQNFDLQIDRAAFARFGGGEDTQFDEVRFGASWSDVTTVVDPDDVDGDGISDAYEVLNGLTVGVDDSRGDLDHDDSTNLEEFIRGTRANVFDTDGDGIRDGWEDGGGIFVSAMKTGSDPLLADTDGDGLRDGYEDNGGVFVSATKTGTNPNMADTDGDHESDATEVREGTNPNLIADSSAARGLVAIDGVKDALYPVASSVQTVQTGFGDNFSELNAAYAYVKDGVLHLLLTGNLPDDSSKLEIFVDSAIGGQTTFAGVPGNNGSDVMNGMVFDNGFTPDFHLIASRGPASFDLNIANLSAGKYDAYRSIFKVDNVAVSEGVGNTPVGRVNARPIRVAYTNSNLAGIGGDEGALANQVAALAVKTGFELKIALTDLGNPSGVIRIQILQNNKDHKFLSNQSLGGLPVTTRNLGNPVTVNFNKFAGEQFFKVLVGARKGPTISNCTVDLTKKEFLFQANGLVVGEKYYLQNSTNLKTWKVITGTNFVAPSARLKLALGSDFKSKKPEYFRVMEGVSK